MKKLPTKKELYVELRLLVDTLDRYGFNAEISTGTASNYMTLHIESKGVFVFSKNIPFRKETKAPLMGDPVYVKFSNSPSSPVVLRFSSGEIDQNGALRTYQNIDWKGVEYTENWCSILTPEHRSDGWKL